MNSDGQWATAIEARAPGPSKRADADIARSVNDVLGWTAYLPVSDVQVMVEGGWVTLTGELEGDYPRRPAMNAIRSLTGVTGVSDQTVIKPRAALRAIAHIVHGAVRRLADHLQCQHSRSAPASEDGRA